MCSRDSITSFSQRLLELRSLHGVGVQLHIDRVWMRLSHLNNEDVAAGRAQTERVVSVQLLQVDLYQTTFYHCATTNTQHHITVM